MSSSSHIRRHWAIFLGLVVGLVVWGALDVARRARIDPERPALHMTDFTVYTEAGAAFFDGREPYEVTNVRGWKYLYPPLFALLVSPLAHLSPPWQASVWFGLSALMAFGCYFECRRLVWGSMGSEVEKPSDGSETLAPQGREGDRVSFGEGLTHRSGGIPWWLFVTALLAPLFPALNCLQRGQMGIALVYPMLLGARLVWLGRTPTQQFLGGTLLALPIALKLTPALPVACLIAMLGLSLLTRGRSWSQFGSAATGLVVGCTVFFLLLPSALIGWEANLRHLQTWYVKVASRVDDVRSDDFGGDVASFRNQSLHNAVFRSGNWVAHKFFGGPDDVRMDVRLGAMPMDAPIVSRLLTAARLVALALLGMILLVAGRSGRKLPMLAAFGMACVATLVVSPVSRGHYFVFWLPAVVFVPLWLQELGRLRAALIAAVVPAALTVAHYVLLPYAGRIGLLGLGTAAWYFAVCVMVWHDRRRVTGATKAIDRTVHPPLAFHRAA